MIRWGACFARARAVPLEVAVVGSSKDTELREAIDRALDEAITNLPEDGDKDVSELVPECHIRPEPRSIEPSQAYYGVLSAIRQLDASLVVVDKQETRRGEMDLGTRLMNKALCDVILMRVGDEAGSQCDNILVPAAGGPHARVALGLVKDVAHNEDAQVTALYVEPEIGEDAEEVGQCRVEHALREAGVKSDDRVHSRVIVADSVSKGIAAVAEEGFDLLIVGASDRNFMRRTLFSTVPAKLLGGPVPITIAVLRSAKPLAERAREAIDKWLARRVPQLDRSNRIQLFDRLQSGSRWSFDFLALIVLSTAIAALGLIQDSPAVVIGAMLVAPLLTPMLGAGLSLVQGNVPLVKEAARSIVLGFVLALGVGFVIGLLTPIRSLNHELLARGAPNLLDLAIALLSGAAAAYAVARPNLSGALPGVAIAAALVPPIATSGIAFAIGEYGTATGAAALFGLNLIAIVLGCSTAFYCIGVRGFRKHTHRSLWVRRTVLALILTALFASFPLGSMLLSKLAVERALPETMVEQMEERIADEHGVDLISVNRPNDDLGMDLEVVLVAAEPASEVLAADLAEIARTHSDEPVQIRVVTRLATVAEAH